MGARKSGTVRHRRKEFPNQGPKNHDMIELLCLINTGIYQPGEEDLKQCQVSFKMLCVVTNTMVVLI